MNVRIIISLPILKATDLEMQLILFAMISRFLDFIASEDSTKVYSHILRQVGTGGKARPLWNNNISRHKVASRVSNAWSGDKRAGWMGRHYHACSDTTL